MDCELTAAKHAAKRNRPRSAAQSRRVRWIRRMSRESTRARRGPGIRASLRILKYDSRTPYGRSRALGPPPSVGA
ncbi:hypothetical protein GCM10010343_19390 [Streptomyces avidinii]|nr:hypothetical protein GCM10010343_19390 [Streptomyces avidinii]